MEHWLGQCRCSTTDKCTIKILFIYTVDYRSAIKKWNCKIHKKMGRARNHYLEWDNSDLTRQISYCGSYFELLDICV